MIQDEKGDSFQREERLIKANQNLKLQFESAQKEQDKLLQQLRTSMGKEERAKVEHDATKAILENYKTDSKLLDETV